MKPVTRKWDRHEGNSNDKKRAEQKSTTATHCYTKPSSKALRTAALRRMPHIPFPMMVWWCQRCASLGVAVCVVVSYRAAHAIWCGTNDNPMPAAMTWDDHRKVSPAHFLHSLHARECFPRTYYLSFAWRIYILHHFCMRRVYLCLVFASSSVLHEGPPCSIVRRCEVK